MSASAVLMVANAAIVTTPPFTVVCAAWALSSFVFRKVYCY
jgi:hypothetical protein